MLRRRPALAKTVGSRDCAQMPTCECSNDLRALARVPRARILRNPSVVSAWLSATSPEVRFAAAERLTDIGVWPVPAALEALQRERNQTVRLQLIEAAARASDRNTRRCLWKAAASARGDLERAVAADALSVQAVRGDVRRLRRLERLETRQRVRVSLAFARYCAGDRSALTVLTDGLRSRSYVVRCAVASMLSDVSTGEHGSAVRRALEEQLGRERTIAAKSAIEKAIVSLDARARSKPARRRSVVSLADA